MSRDYTELTGLLREAATLFYVENLLAWDQEVMMPAGGAAFRAEQVALLGRLAHERFADPRLGDLIAACESDPLLTADPAVKANLVEMRRRHERARRLPADLVSRSTESGSRALEAWRHARESRDFAVFRPWLEQQIELARERADCLGAPRGGEPYDALVQEHEPDLSCAEIDRLFRPLRAGLVALVGEIASAGTRPDGIAGLRLAVTDQQRFHRHLLACVGFDFSRGRFDVSTHPFSTSIAPDDTRLTTRFGEERFIDGLSATLHEAGHALYEQGRPAASYPGQPLGEPASLGIHESQSRLWENHVGRSRAFWSWALREARHFFNGALDGLTADDLYRAANRVSPGPIRTGSDEATCNLHILMRCDLERAMVRGDLAVADLPAAWNERMRRDLGVEVRDDGDGCLQDMHWARGAFGYFPGYALGDVYAAQLWDALAANVTDLDEQLARGDFSDLLGWLREHVHRPGRRFSAPELIRRATGSGPDHRFLLRHLDARLRPLHGLDPNGEPEGGARDQADVSTAASAAS